VPTFAFPVVANLLVLLFLVFQGAHGPVLWVLAVLFLLGTSFWVRRSTSIGSVGCHLIAVYLALGALFSCWTFDGHRDQWPMAAMHPGFLTMVMLDRHFPREFSSRPWFLVLATYWAALAVNLVWARWWAIRSFDRLAGLSDQRLTPGIPLIGWFDPLDRWRRPWKGRGAVLSEPFAGPMVIRAREGTPPSTPAQVPGGRL
jgi:hypothetical protein